MTTEYDGISEKAISKASRTEFSDFFCRGRSYFSCGSSTSQFYNNSYAIAIALIGKIYASDNSNKSDYHNGIAFIANALGLSKRQVKVLRKNFKTRSRYSFKTPYSIPEIIEKIIELLQHEKNNDLIQDFCQSQNTPFYRNMLIEKQYRAIQIAASRGNREEVLLVEGKLNQLIQRYV